MHNLDKSLAAYVETDIIGKPTIRHNACSIILENLQFDTMHACSIILEEGEICSRCKEHRKSLQAMVSRYAIPSSNKKRTAA